MTKLRYLSQAKDDLIAIKRYIARESGRQSVALQFTEKLRRPCRGANEVGVPDLIIAQNAKRHHC